MKASVKLCVKSEYRYASHETGCDHPKTSLRLSWWDNAVTGEVSHFRLHSQPTCPSFGRCWVDRYSWCWLGGSLWLRLPFVWRQLHAGWTCLHFAASKLVSNHHMGSRTKWCPHYHYIHVREDRDVVFLLSQRMVRHQIQVAGHSNPPIPFTKVPAKKRYLGGGGE